MAMPALYSVERGLISASKLAASRIPEASKGDDLGLSEDTLKGARATVIFPARSGTVEVR